MLKLEKNIAKYGIKKLVQNGGAIETFGENKIKDFFKENSHEKWGGEECVIYTYNLDGYSIELIDLKNGKLIEQFEIWGEEPLAAVREIFCDKMLVQYDLSEEIFQHGNTKAHFSIENKQYVFCKLYYD